MSLELINQVVELTNIERAKEGLKPLTLNSQLVDAAQDHSSDMAQDDFFSHTGADGSNVGSRVQDSGYQYSTTGENIAAGQTTAEEVVEGWMNSPGHRANILNPDFTEIGIGYEYLENDTGSVNYNHYWTQVFGTPLNNSGAGIDSQPTVEETPEPAPVEEVETVEPSAPVENTADDSSNVEESASPEQADLELETVEEISEPAPAQEAEDINNTNDIDLEESASPEQSDLESEAVEEINIPAPAQEVEDSNNIDDNDSDLEESSTPEETNLELDTVEESSDAPPVEDIESVEQSGSVEDVHDNDLNLNDLITFEYSYSSDINGEFSCSALAGGEDAVNFFEYIKDNAYNQDIDRVLSDYFESISKSFIGMGAEIDDSSDFSNHVKCEFTSNWTEGNQDFMQHISGSFL